jgi:nitric oxide reductase subunit B
MANRNLWRALIVVIGGSFAVLGYCGKKVYRQATPVPERVVTADGGVLFTGQDRRPATT